MSSRSSVYQEFRTNAALTKEAEDEVRRTMGRTLKKLDAVEMEIARLQNRLVVLGRREQETKHFIEVHEGFLSPIRRLVPEILQVIFWLCLPVAHNSVLSAKEAPLLLGRVCSQWRRIAYSTPKLWCSLHIAVPPLTYPQAQAMFEASEAWITRSGILPLSISISDFEQMEVSEGQFRPYFELITKHARRWKTIHLHVPLCDIKDFLMQLDVDRYPILEGFHTDQGTLGEVGTLDVALWKKDGILAAPSLRVLSINNLSKRLFDLPVRWNLLTGLDLMYSDRHEVFKLLSLCSNLEMCALHLDISDLPYSNSQFFDDSGPNVVLSKLRTLKITGGSGYNSLIPINTLSTPALRHFAYFHTYKGRVYPYPDFSVTSNVFRSFFERLNQPLEELEFETDSAPVELLMELLSFLPDLKRLSLIHTSVLCYSPSPFGDCLLLGFIPSEHRSHCQSCLSEADNVGDFNLSYPLSSPCLCPNLEILNVARACLSKHVLFEYLRSRLVDYDKYNVTRLRRFSVSFMTSVEDYEMMEEIDDGWVDELGLVVKLGDKSLATVGETSSPSEPPCIYFAGI
ncbi:hypothetical protein AGABI2DRAFT_121621 [Agaricus bisporus var. bisporus H97]|uniref:hypothetical protein n=1 Tax=Agaricus bisporus var. bisporus (strain H97 / ATCC MYA-4626 / FGSC 10389) TaxID=936046 RepID=UPI00029F7BA5|nr:hypothetical protein AGABI2DRAFT_121621 [Agaricus bisporus var. bisporus H97]EKV43495.1 hypothetical protein AGABI2DRAFT_121621 [Agaricus bisporus var. bisporus H97]